MKGIRVANFGWVWAGPVVGQTLGFLGAEVYKIESRARIDLTRMLPPFAGGVRDPDRSLSNHAAWAGNGSVTLNLKKPAAQELARQLIAKCDVVVENFGPGAMADMHLGYEVLRAVKPDLVMLSMPAAGLSGPLKNVRTYGLSLSSITGLDSLTGYVGGPPVPFENAFADPYNGVMGAFAVLAALTYRDRTGSGQHIDYSQQEAVMQMVGPAFMDYAINGRVAGPKGNRHPLDAAAPHGVFPCAGDDRWISIAVATRAGMDRAAHGDGQSRVGNGRGVRQRWRSVCRTSTRCTNGWRRGRVPSTTTRWRNACSATASPRRRCSTSPICCVIRTTARAARSSRSSTRWDSARRSTART